MANTLSRKTLLLMLAAGISITAPALVQAQSIEGYVIDSRNTVTKSGYDLCWRTGYWTPAMAVEECDPDLVAKPAAPGPVTGAVTPPPPPPREVKVTLSADALFDFDKAVLRPEGRQALDNLVMQAQGVALEVIIVTGHTDRIGRQTYNQNLSQQRAEAVKTYLVQGGVPADRVYAEGKGSTQPVTGDECRKMGKENRFNKKLIECLQSDRRVDIELIGTQKQ